MTDFSLGSGSALLGGGNEALQAAIQRRSQGQGGATGSVTPASPTFNPQIQQPEVSPAPMGGQSSPPPSVGTGMGLPAESPESTLILKALDSRLKSLSKQEEMRIGA